MSQFAYFYITANPILFMFGTLILQLSEWLEIDRNNFIQHLHVILGKISYVKVVQTMTHFNTDSKFYDHRIIFYIGNFENIC